MAWDELRTSRGNPANHHEAGAWYISLRKRPRLRVVPPKGHPLLQAERVRTFFGRGEDEGWMLLRPSTDERGRKYVYANKAHRYLGYSRVPGVADDMILSMVQVEAVDLPDGGVKLRLPWAVGAVAEGLDLAKFIRPAPKTECAAPAPTVESSRSEAAGAAAQRPETAHQDEAAQIEEYIAQNGVTRPWTLEQAAEFLRERRRDCVVQVGESGRQGRTPSHRWLDRPRVLLSGAEIPVSELFRIVNDYREEEGLPAVVPPSSTAASPSPQRAAVN